MTSILKRLLSREKKESQDEFIEDDKLSDTPYVASALFYLTVVLFIGVPMWFVTCSKTRYSLPDLTQLENKLTDPIPRLHLEISVIQLARYDALRPDDDFAHSDDPQTDYLRANLPSYLNTSTESVAYNINWRVRRPTHDEHRIFDQYQRQTPNSHESIDLQLVKLEESLTKVHKSTNRFRLFMYLIDSQHYSAFCDKSRVHTYTVSFERFVYLCPSTALASKDNHEPIVNLIKTVLDELYVNTIDLKKAKHIIGAQIDLLFSLIPELPSTENLNSLSSLADKIHQIYNKNVREKFPELKELINISPITQNIVGLINEQQLNKMIIKTKNKADYNSTGNTTAPNTIEPRILQVNNIEQLFHDFEARLSKHSSQNVQNVLTIAPDPDEPHMVLKQKQSDKETISILEGHDMNSLMIANDDKTIVLAIRALVRRIAGLSSVNLCSSCLVRRDVFFNRWELDAIMAMLTLTKLQNTLISLKSISQQVIGIKIPKDVATIVSEAHGSALTAIEHLETKRILESYRSASKAYELSETAFYDPSLLESLYFPDDLKYAIYLPLFLPLVLPFGSSVVSLIKFAFRRKKSKVE